MDKLLQTYSLAIHCLCAKRDHVRSIVAAHSMLSCWFSALPKGRRRLGVPGFGSTRYLWHQGCFGTRPGFDECYMSRLSHWAYLRMCQSAGHESLRQGLLCVYLTVVFLGNVSTIDAGDWLFTWMVAVIVALLIAPFLLAFSFLTKSKESKS